MKGQSFGKKRGLIKLNGRPVKPNENAKPREEGDCEPVN
jgi:hypothetical protein